MELEIPLNFCDLQIVESTYPRGVPCPDIRNKLPRIAFMMLKEPDI